MTYQEERRKEQIENIKNVLAKTEAEDNYPGQKQIFNTTKDFTTTFINDIEKYGLENATDYLLISLKATLNVYGKEVENSKKPEGSLSD